jgi:hypothetical protein
MRLRAGARRGVLIGLIAASLGGPSSALAEDHTLQLQSGLRVSGAVRDVHGDPVADVVVGVCTAVDECFTSSGVSAADGSYVVRGLTAGSYYVQGYPDGDANVLSAWYAGTAVGSHAPGDAVPIDVQADVSGIDFSMPEGLRITGTVKDPEGHPVAGVTVAADGRPIPSDGTGAFQIVGLAPGSYQLFVEPPDTGVFPSGYVADGIVQESDEGATPVDVTTADVTGVQITLFRGRTISGKVTAPAGTPIEVSALDASIRYTFRAAADGSFTVRGLYPGSYHLLFAIPENGVDSQFPYGIFNGNGKVLTSQDHPGVAINVTAGNVGGISAVVPTLPSIQGTVRDASGPVKGAGVHLCDPDRGCAAVHAAADGTFRARNVPPGSYTIQAGAAGHVVIAYSAGRSIPDGFAGTPVTMGTSTISVALVLPIGGTISGSVTGAGSVPLPGIDVSASPTSGGIWEFGPGGAVTGADGSFSVPGLQDGEYVIQASPDPYSDYRFGYWSTGGVTPNYADATRIQIDDATAPVVGTPVASFGVGSQLGTTTVPVRLAWSAVDPGSGLSGFGVQQSTSGGAWTAVASPPLASTTRSLAPSTTRTYRFRVHGTDFSDNTSAYATGPAFRVLQSQQNASAVTTTGSWSTTTSSSASGGSYRSTTAGSATATFAFTGRAVAWAARTGSGFGKAKVYLDGKLLATVDLGGTAASRRVVFAWSGATSASHKLRIVNLATAGRPRISVDAFVVLR